MEQKNFLQDIRDSVETSVHGVKLFTSLKTASYYHVFNSRFEMFPIAQCRDLDNFNPDRLSEDPYPSDKRPRGDADISSVVFHRRTIRKVGHTEPIWIALKKGKYTLLDGAHRIVATYLENKRSIPAYVINMDEHK